MPLDVLLAPSSATIAPFVMVAFIHFRRDAILGAFAKGQGSSSSFPTTSHSSSGRVGLGGAALSWFRILPLDRSEE